MPSKGKMKVSKAASTRPGLRIQKRNSAKRGKNPAISARRHPMLQPPSHFNSAYGQVRRPFDQEDELNTSILNFLSLLPTETRSDWQESKRSSIRPTCESLWCGRWQANGPEPEKRLLKVDQDPVHHAQELVVLWVHSPPRPGGPVSLPRSHISSAEKIIGDRLLDAAVFARFLAVHEERNGTGFGEGWTRNELHPNLVRAGAHPFFASSIQILVACLTHLV
jgi:hypothetical protein